MKEIRPDDYKALLNWIGLNTKDLQLPKGTVRPAFQVLYGEDMPLGTVFCHQDNVIPLKQAIEYNTGFLHDLERYVGIRSSEYTKIGNRIVELNQLLLDKENQDQAIPHNET